MYFSTSFIATTLLGCATATTHMMSGAQAVASETLSGAGAESTGVTAGMVNVHVVQVGLNGLTFSPDNVIAQPGDMVQFQFHPKNHSVVQSTFDQPCVPIQNIMPNKTDAFFSGYMPASNTSAPDKGTLSYTIRVMDTKPIWFYCSQAKHCQGGMVGAINAAPTGNKTVQAFAALAATQPENLTPGQVAGAAGASSAAPPEATATLGAGGIGGFGGNTTVSTASASSANNPAQVTGSGSIRHFEASRQSLLGLGMAGVAALLAL